MRNILFIRKYPTSLASGWLKGLRGSFNSIFRNGQTETIKGHKITFFFPGYGTHIRDIPDSIIRDIVSGEISDIVDFGGGGALDPALKTGDLFLSKGEICCNGLELLNIKRRPHVENIIKKMADELGRCFYKGKILTASKIVAGRSKRLEYYKKLDVGIVQMEHYWFINKLRKLVAPELFDALYFTHVELVVDEVPRENMSCSEIAKEFLRVLAWFLRNDYYLGRLKIRFLSEFLSNCEVSSNY